MLRGGVEIDAYVVDATLDRLVKGIFEFRLVDIVLILSYTNALGIDLDEFCQGIHEATADGNGSANGDILIRELVAGDYRGRIDRGTIFADGEHLRLYFLLL